MNEDDYEFEISDDESQLIFAEYVDLENSRV